MINEFLGDIEKAVGFGSPVDRDRDDRNIWRIKYNEYDERYKVTIVSKIPSSEKGKYVYSGVETYLQGDKLRLNVESNWQSIDPVKGGILEVMAQAATFSIQNKIMSRRMWTGTSPLRLNIPLKFTAIDDASKEIIEPVKILQKMALPGQWKYGFLRPPGPNPFYWEPTANLIKKFIAGRGWKANVEILKGEKISIWIGNYLVFPSVILTDVNVEFSNYFDAKGSPISANVDILFETYMMYTKKDLEQAYSAPLDSDLINLE